MASVSPYETFLANFRGLLQQHKRKLADNGEDSSEFGNPTGIEPSLSGKYLDQMIQLNTIMATTASTNYPNNPYFQEMFLDGWIHRDYLSSRVYRELQNNHISFQVRSVLDLEKEGEGALVNFYDVDDAELRVFTHSMFDLGRRKRSHFPNEAIPLLDRIIVDINTGLSFPQAFELMSNNDKDMLRNYMIDNKLKQPRNVDSDTAFSILAAKSNIVLETDFFTADILTMVKRGELLAVGFENNYDPFDRNLYSILYKILTQ